MPFLAIAGVGLVVLAIALAALLMLMAGHIIHGITKGIFDHIPGVGGILSDGISLFLGTVTQGANALYDRLVHPVAHWFWAYAMGPWHLAWNMVLSIADAKGWAVKAQQDAQAAQAAGIAAAAAAQANAIAVANQNLSTAEGFAAGAAAEAETYADLRVSQAVATAERLYNSAIAHADQNLTTAETYAADVGHLAEGYAQGLANDVRSEAVRLFGQAEAGIRTLEGQVQGIPAEIAGEIANVVPGDIARALAAAGVASIPGLLSQVQALTTEAETCLHPLCDTVTPNAGRLGNLGNLFKGMENLGVEALFIALAAEVMTNPQAVVTDISTVTHEVGDTVMTGFRDLIGV